MKFKLLLLSLATIVIFSTCETEIDISGDYSRTPVVYGLLDIAQDTQYVMINRTFLGIGNAVEIAQNQDSMLYDEVDARIYYGDASDDYVSLAKTSVCCKDVNGIFYSGSIWVYAVASSELWPGWTPTNFNPNAFTDIIYRLQVVADGEDIYAETKLTSARGGNNAPGSIFYPPASISNVNFVSSFNSGGSTYYATGLRFSWNNVPSSVKNAIKHEAYIRFNYTEVLVDGTRNPKQARFRVATVDEEVTNSNVSFSSEQSGEVFFQRVADRIESNSDVKYREIGAIDYILTVAGVDFTTYLNIGDPVSSVGQSRPSFSNINDGEGVGIFSSRDTYIRTKPLYTDGQEADIKEMVEGLHTQNFCFCDPTPGSTYDCANTSNQCQ